MIKVLVVDNSALARKLFVRVLAREPDMEVAFARNGREALSQLSDFMPDVVEFLDINMPEMDGLDCLDRIMVERPCPVLMVSSFSSEGAETTLEALRLGAVDFIAKPGGAVSLHMDDFGPELVEKVRNAANAKLRASLRLRERVLHRIGAAASQHTQKASDHPDAPRQASGPGVVVVGTSTGGPPALEALLSPLPASFPWPIVIAQHMPASFTGPLARRLDRLCALTVTEVDQPVALSAGRAYIGRGDADVIILRRRQKRNRVSGAGHGLPVATERRPSGSKRDGALCAEPDCRRPDDGNGQRWGWRHGEPSRVGRAYDRRVGGDRSGLGDAGSTGQSRRRDLDSPLHRIADKLQQVVGHAARPKTAR